MIHGVINIYKEKGYTSHDVVAKLRGIVGQKKIGHTGTLDPDAVGVLPVCLGKATKLCDMLTDKSKTYEAVLLLGKETDTQDITGEVLKERETDHLTEEEVKACILGFVGNYDQVPPMYSALKVNGKKLYELARAGVEVERKSRRVEIYDIRILEMNLPRVRMEVHCSKGTYIRTLCHDIGQNLACGGCMEALKRIQVGPFLIADSVTLKEVEQYRDENRLAELIRPIEDMFDGYEKVTLKPEFCSLVYNGNFFLSKHVEELMLFADGQMVRVYNPEGRFLAIYQYQQENHQFRIEKMFYSKDEG